MKIAIVYNRESQAVINLFGTLNREKYGLETINDIKNALEKGGHQVRTFEGDKNIIEKLEKFMPSVISGERPGLVFNLSYGIQGKGRYMHIPGILEMLGIPYVGSGPDTHAIALDKVVTKMIIAQKGLPTPRFTVMDRPDSPFKEDLKYPLIVKPKDEAVSFGLRIVHNEEELREGVRVIFTTFNTPTLVEEYIDGREINVGLLGNNPVVALPPVELNFGEGLQIYTFEDKKNTSGRTVEKICPAPLSQEETEKIQQLAIDTFNALGCSDSARVDFRLDKEGNPYILEVNSMASLGDTSSFVFAAEKMGLDYTALINRLIDVAYERYFGPYILPSAENGVNDMAVNIFNVITRKRDDMEEELKTWTNIPSWTEDPVGIHTVLRKIEERMNKLGLTINDEHTNGRSAWTWSTKAGFKDGTLIVIPLDIPGNRTGFPIPFRSEQEWLYGEGIASSRGGLTTLLRTLEALKEIKVLDSRKIGVFYYNDEGRGMRYSSPTLVEAAKWAKQVIIMQPGFEGGKIIDQRRGTKKFAVILEGVPIRVGSRAKQIDALSYFLEQAHGLQALSSPDKKLTVAVHDLHSERYSVLLPHRVKATVSLTYLDENLSRMVENEIRNIFKSNPKGIQAFVEKLEERPPLIKRKNNPLLNKLETLSEELKIPFGTESSLLATAAGVIPEDLPVVCGFGPASRGLYTPNEAINRSELIEKTLLLALLLLE
ncbi:MAG: M20/M25/M40 family metallo-hydrolase [Eubacteriales bacterium]|nr:M20/M25/M40 family metallo-hydrolase [Eubacteriales bacterium]